MSEPEPAFVLDCSPAACGAVSPDGDEWRRRSVRAGVALPPVVHQIILDTDSLDIAAHPIAETLAKRALQSEPWSGPHRIPYALRRQREMVLPISEREREGRIDHRVVREQERRDVALPEYL